ncbi:M56 family metallopeptidase [Christiangramia portivictoriae]|uniref:M56 family metallopeptidase n=1 Tax=Christiangramia portivictoriae TaxID=326069 RepID=UPI0004144DF8|nr:M56 family metallopeptidase [Christiangramia portivictoriae]
MEHYIIQVILFQLGFFVIYEVLLEKETFFKLNRAYLIATPILAFLIPFIKIGSLQQMAPARAMQQFSDQMILMPEVFIGNKTANSSIVTAESASTNWLLWIYLAGVVLSLSIFIVKILKIQKITGNSRKLENRFFKLREVPDSNTAFTYFDTLYIGDQISEKDKNHVITHELVHLHDHHGFDLMIFEILRILFWFNPLIYIFQSRLATLHEYIADSTTVKKSGKKQYFEQLLNTAFGTENFSFTNQFFSHSLIKKRIIMLQKNQSSNISKFKFLLIIPMLMLMLTYVACSDDNYAEIPEDKPQSRSEILADLKTYLQNKDSLTDDEKDQFLEIIKLREELLLKEAKANGTEIIEVVEEQILPPPPPAPGSLEDIQNRADNSEYDNATEVPFAVIDKVPAFQECDQWVDDARKNCTSSEISDFVNKNFNTSLGKELGLVGVNRVIVQFRIDENGQVQDIKSRAARPELEEEAKRVISELPSFIPGEQNGRAVSVMYSLPIAFQVQ